MKLAAVVIYFSGRKGLSKADETAAQAIAKGGALVAEVDSKKYLSGLDKLKEKCHELVYDTELLTRQLERERRLPTYLTPIVAGVGEGGTLAELNLVQAPAVTIAGAVSIDPAEIIASRRPICSDLPTTARRGGFRYGAPKKLPGFWIVGLTHHVRRADREYMMRAASRGRADRSPRDAAQHGDGRRIAIVDRAASRAAPARGRKNSHEYFADC